MEKDRIKSLSVRVDYNTYSKFKTLTKEANVSQGEFLENLLQHYVTPLELRNHLIIDKTDDDYLKILLRGMTNEPAKILKFKGDVLINPTVIRPFNLDITLDWFKDFILSKNDDYRNISLDPANNHIKTEFQFCLCSVDEPNQKKYLMYEYFRVDNYKAGGDIHIKRAWSFDSLEELFDNDNYPERWIDKYLNAEDIEKIEYKVANEITFDDL